MLNKETFPPVADITYESFFESAMHGTASSRLTPVTSLVIRRPLFGCQCCGTTLAVAFKFQRTSEFCLPVKGNIERKSQKVKETKTQSYVIEGAVPFQMDSAHYGATSIASEHHLTQVPKYRQQNLCTKGEQPSKRCNNSGINGIKYLCKPDYRRKLTHLAGGICAVR